MRANCEWRHRGSIEVNFLGKISVVENSAPNQTVIQTLIDYYRVPEDSFGFAHTAAPLRVRRSRLLSIWCGEYLLRAMRVRCCGRRSRLRTIRCLNHVRRDGTTIHLPFEFTEVVDNLRLERYRQKLTSGHGQVRRERISPQALLLHQKLSAGFSPPPDYKEPTSATGRNCHFQRGPSTSLVDTLHERVLAAY